MKQQQSKTSASKAVLSQQSVAKLRAALEASVKSEWDRISSPEYGLDPELEMRYAIALLRTNAFLASVAEQNPASFVGAVLDVVRFGLTLNPVSSLAYLIPRKVGDAGYTVIGTPSYRGLEAMVLRSGVIKMIQSGEVFANDEYRQFTDKNGRNINHIVARGDRGAFESVYTIARYANGETHIETMSAADIEACKEAARRAGNDRLSPAWLYFEGEQRKKCCVRRAAKHWPQDRAITHAMEVMDQTDPMVFEPAEEKPVETMTDANIEAICAAMPNVPDEQKPVWLTRMAQAIGFSDIKQVPSARLDEVITRITARHKKLYGQA